MLGLTGILKQKEPNRIFQNIYRSFHPDTKEYTFSVSQYLMELSPKLTTNLNTNLNRYKKIEITLCILPDHHEVNLVNNRNPTNAPGR